MRFADLSPEFSYVTPGVYDGDFQLVFKCPTCKPPKKPHLTSIYITKDKEVGGKKVGWWLWNGDGIYPDRPPDWGKFSLNPSINNSGGGKNGECLCHISVIRGIVVPG